MTLPWIEAQIEETLNAENSAKNVYDLAMLCICRDEMQRRAAPDVSEYAEAAEDKKRRDAVVLTSYSADLDTVPTLEQIDSALGAYSVNTAEERERVKDMRTWREIIKSGKSSGMQ